MLVVSATFKLVSFAIKIKRKERKLTGEDKSVLCVSFSFPLCRTSLSSGELPSGSKSSSTRSVSVFSTK